MKLLLIIFVFFLLLGNCPSTATAQAESEPVSFSTAPYKIGEKLTYTVSFSSFSTAASVETEIVGRGLFLGRDGLELRANVQTNDAISATLLDINNDYTTYVDPENGRPYRTQQITREGGSVESTSRDYSQPVPSKLRKNEVIGIYDLVSAIYRVRALPLKQDSTYRITANHSNEQYNVEVEVGGKQFIKTNVGSFNAITTQIRVGNNSDINNYRIRVFFSSDERHIPVLILARHSVGEIRVEIASSELPIEQPQPNVNPAIIASSQPRQQSQNNASNVNNRMGNNVNNPTLSQPPNGIGPNGGNINPTIMTPQVNGLSNPTINQPNSRVGGPSAIKPFPPDVPFTANEQLNFNIYWQTSPQPLGRVSFRVSQRQFINGRDSLSLTAKVDSATNAITKFLNLNDTFSSYLDPETLLPYQTDIKLQQSNSRYNQTLTLEQNRGNAVTDKNARIEIPVGTHDILSFAYALRLFDLTPNKETPVSLLLGNRTFVLVIKSLRRETIEIGGQTIKAIQLQIETETDQQSSDKFSLRLWVSDDRRRLPLRFTAKLSEGSLRADLIIATK